MSWATDGGPNGFSSGSGAPPGSVRPHQMTPHEFAALLTFDIMLLGFGAQRGPNPDVCKLIHHKKGYTVWIKISAGQVEVSGFKVTRRAFCRHHMYFNTESLAFVIDRVKTSFKLV